MHRSDPELWQNILAGNASAWKELVRRYQALIYTVATRSGLSVADSADCFQQTFVLLYQNRHKLQDPSRLSAWLVTTAKREAIRLSRQSQGVRDHDQAPEVADSSALPDESLEKVERLAQINEALSQLDDRCQALLKALFFASEDFSYEEIAKSVGIAFNSLGPIRGRCLQRLRKVLEANGYLDVRESL